MAQQNQELVEFNFLMSYLNGVHSYVDNLDADKTEAFC